MAANEGKSNQGSAAVDAYIERVASEPARRAMRALRSAIREAAPEAEEVISYGIPTFKFHGFVAGIGAFKRHCSFFPGHTVAAFAEALADYDTAKGTVRFPHTKPIPTELVKAIVANRVAENLAVAASKGDKPASTR